LESLTESVSDVNWVDVDPFNLLTRKQREHYFKAVQRHEMAELEFDNARAQRDPELVYPANERANLTYKALRRCREFVRERTLAVIGVDVNLLNDDNRRRLSSGAV